MGLWISSLAGGESSRTRRGCFISVGGGSNLPQVRSFRRRHWFCLINSLQDDFALNLREVPYSPETHQIESHVAACASVSRAGREL